MSAKTMATSGQWTIPSDPGQKFQRGGVEPPRAVARVKPEAAVIAKANVDGSIALVFNQHPPVPKRPQSDRRESRDHQKDNVERMRKIQAAYKAKQQEEQQRQQTLGASAGGRSRPLRAVHSQHEGAKARVDTNLRTQAPVQEPRPHRSHHHRPSTAPACHTCGQALPDRTQWRMPTQVPQLDIDSDSTAADGQRHQQAKAPIKPKVARPGPSQAAASVPRQRPRSASLNRRSATAMDVRDSGPDVGGRHGRPQSVAGYQEQRPPVQQAWAASGTRYSEPKAPRGKERRSSRNFVAENVQLMSDKPRMQRSSSVGQLAVTGSRKSVDDYRKGQVPDYLRKRQEQWRQDERDRIASQPDPNCPAGHVLMSTEERLSTLQQLHDNHNKLSRELQSMPVRTDTLRVKNRKSELERTLGELDDALKIFSRPKVYVKQDE